MPNDGSPRLPSRREWDELFPELALVEFVQACFPRLRMADCQDIGQNVYVEVAKRIDKAEPFLDQTLTAYARWLAKKRALDLLRPARERQLFGDPARDEDSEPWNPIEPHALTPSKEAAERERQERQVQTLAALLEEFCHQYERGDLRRRRWKQVLERTLRGQSVTEIAQEMEFSSVAAVHQVFHRMFDPLVTILKRHDPNGSILKTLGRALGIDQKSGNHRPGAIGTYVQSYEELKNYLFQESGAFCPLPERWDEYCRQPNTRHVADIRYHLAAGCPLCRADERVRQAEE